MPNMPVSYIGAGTAPAATASATAPPVAYPTGISAGDLLVAIFGVKRVGGSAPTFAGWTLAATSVVAASGVAAAAGVGEQRIYVLTKIADGTETGSISFLNSGADNTNTRMLAFTYDSTGFSSPQWEAVASTSFAHASSTAWGGSGAADIGLTASDHLVCALLVADDTARGATPALSLSNNGNVFGTLIDVGHVLMTTGGDSAMTVMERPVTSGTSNAAPTATLTGGAAETGGGIFLRIRATGSTGPVQVNGDAAIGLNLGVTASGVVGKVGAAAVALALGVTSMGGVPVVQKDGDAAIGLNLGVTASGVVGKSASSTAALTLALASSGTMGTVGVATAPLTLSLVADGIVEEAPPGGVTFSDDFNRANGNAGSNWTNLAGGTSNLDVVSNAAANNATAGSGTTIHRITTVLPSADGYAEFEVTTFNTTSTGVMIRLPTSTSEAGYLWRYNGTDAQLFSVIGGSYNAIGSAYVASISAPFTLRIEAEGTAIRGYVNGTLRASATDSTVTAAGYSGMRLSSTAIRVDNFSTGTLGAPPTQKNGAATIPLSLSMQAAGQVGRVGAATIPLTLGVTATGQVGRAGDATAALNLGVNASGVMQAIGQAAIPLTLAVSSGGAVGKVGGANPTLTLSVVAAGQVFSGSSASLPLNLAVTSTGRVGKTGDANPALNLAVNATGTVGRSSAAAIPLTLGVQAEGVVGKRSGATIIATFGVTAAGTTVAPGQGNAVIAGTFTVTAVGVVGRRGAASLPLTLAVVSTGAKGFQAPANGVGATFGMQATGTVGKVGVAGPALNLGVQASGTVHSRGGAALVGTFGVTADGVVNQHPTGTASVPLTLAVEASGAINEHYQGVADVDLTLAVVATGAVFEGRPPGLPNTVLRSWRERAGRIIGVRERVKPVELVERGRIINVRERE